MKGPVPWAKLLGEGTGKGTPVPQQGMKGDVECLPCASVLSHFPSHVEMAMVPSRVLHTTAVQRGPPSGILHANGMGLKLGSLGLRA